MLLMKTFKIFYACSFVLVIACQKESGQPSLVNSNTQTANATAKHYIGEHYGGGIIFFISKKNKKNKLVINYKKFNIHIIKD